MVNAMGQPILSADDSEITLPPRGSVHISFDGRIFSGDAEIAQLAVVGVDDLLQLEKLGGNLFRVRPGSEIVEEQLAMVMVNQGYLEKANVEVVTEMVNMIEAQRQFEAYQKVMQTSDTLDREAITKVGRARA
jgi:flagellar basal-body rod protein FlgG